MNVAMSGWSWRGATRRGLATLFKVRLMGQVLRQDLSTGRLLDLDVDLPELLSATESAQARFGTW